MPVVQIDGYSRNANAPQLVQAGAVKVTLDGFHATGEAQVLGEGPVPVDVTES